MLGKRIKFEFEVRGRDELGDWAELDSVNLGCFVSRRCARYHGNAIRTSINGCMNWHKIQQIEHTHRVHQYGFKIACMNLWKIREIRVGVTRLWVDARPPFTGNPGSTTA